MHAVFVLESGGIPGEFLDLSVSFNINLTKLHLSFELGFVFWTNTTFSSDTAITINSTLISFTPSHLFFLLAKQIFFNAQTTTK